MTIGSKHPAPTELSANVSWKLGGWGIPRNWAAYKDWAGTDGFDKINPYDMTNTTRNDGMCWGRHINDPQGGTIFPIYFTYAQPRIGVTTVQKIAANQSASNLINKILDTDLQLNIVVAEAPEAIRYIYHRVKPLVKSMNYLRKGDIVRAFRAVGITKTRKGVRIRKPKRGFWAPSSWWLEYRYAITPLVLDVNAAMEYVQRDSGKPRSMNIKASSRQDITYQFTDTGGAVGRREYWPNRKAWESTTTGITMIENFNYTRVDWLNPFTAAWELTPFSFMIDWAIPIGDFLRNRWFFTFSKYTHGYQTHVRKSDTGNFVGENLLAVSGYISENYTVNTLSSAYRRTIHMERELFTGRVPYPRIINPLADLEGGHWKRVVDVFSILSTSAQSNRIKYRL
jgi:hypothetical protein